MVIPKIENIHQKIHDAILAEGCRIDMSTWHADRAKKEDGSYCGTTHCRAGWVIALAGLAGVKLESQTGTCFAAMQIYKASSEIKVSPMRFFDSNEDAMKDIIRCAEEEKALNNK